MVEEKKNKVEEKETKEVKVEEKKPEKNKVLDENAKKIRDLKIELLRGNKRKEIKKAIARLFTVRNSKVEDANK